jgi:hypothetical protein
MTSLSQLQTALADRYTIEREIGPYMDQTDYTAPRSYDVSPNGERFLLKYPTNDTRGRMIVITNWFSELAARVGQRD